MSTPTEGHDPADDIAVSFGQFKQIVLKLEEKIDRNNADLERRTDEALSQRDTNLRIEMKNLRDELGTAINQLTEGVRILAQKSGSKSSEGLGELVDILKPVIQKKLLGDVQEDALTSQVNELGMLTVRGTLKELLNAQKLQVRRMMRKGDLSIADVQKSQVADLVLDQAVDKHARI